MIKNKQLTLLNLCIHIWSKALKGQNADGSMPAGHNGPYHDAETPIRNTSHYLISFVFAWQKTGDITFKNAAVKCLDYLLANDCPYYSGFTYKHRQGGNKDMCNGLIGPAWNIEALLAAGALPRGNEARERAKSIFLLHPFSESLRLWKRVEWNGTVLSEDQTLNHQLWFAACSSPLMSDTPEAKEHIECFLESLIENWALSRSGRIIHPVWSNKRRWRERIKRMIKKDYRKNMLVKEIGYHTFNLYALALLKEQKQECSKPLQRKTDRAMSYLGHREFSQGIQFSPYGFPYNPPGWEVPYATEQLAAISDGEHITNVIQQQIETTFDPATQTFAKNTPDPLTLTARMYECTRLSEKILKLPVQVHIPESGA